MKEAASACKKTLLPDSFYSFNQEYIGLEFKSSFQNLARLEWVGHGTFSANVNIASASQHYQILNSPVHPAVLDSCVQPNLAQISKCLSRTTCPTMMAQCGKYVDFSQSLGQDHRLDAPGQLYRGSQRQDGTVRGVCLRYNRRWLSLVLR